MARPDLRRKIYAGLDVLFAVVYAIAIWTVIPNRWPSAMIHLWAMPVFTLVMGVGMVLGGTRGWRLGVIGGTGLLAALVLLILRLIVSAAFLAGVYGAYGKAASTFTLVAVALLVELVGLLPLVQVKFLLSRAGKRAFGV